MMPMAVASTGRSALTGEDSVLREDVEEIVEDELELLLDRHAWGAALWWRYPPNALVELQALAVAEEVVAS